MTKNLTLKPTQRLYKNWTENQARGLGQFLVKTWSAFSHKDRQSSGKMRVETLQQRFGAASVVLELFQTRSAENQCEQKVSRNGAGLEDFQAKQGGQKLDGNWMKMVHRRFTKTSPDFGGHSLERCRQSNGKMSVVFTLFPRIAEYIWKSPIQFAIPSSYLYVVVLKEPDL